MWPACGHDFRRLGANTAEGSIGPHNAKVAALAFCQTALPFATLDVPVLTTYGEAQKRIRGGRK